MADLDRFADHLCTAIMCRLRWLFKTFPHSGHLYDGVSKIKEQDYLQLQLEKINSDKNCFYELRNFNC